MHVQLLKNVQNTYMYIRLKMLKYHTCIPGQDAKPLLLKNILLKFIEIELPGIQESRKLMCIFKKLYLIN